MRALCLLLATAPAFCLGSAHSAAGRFHVGANGELEPMPDRSAHPHRGRAPSTPPPQLADDDDTIPVPATDAPTAAERAFILPPGRIIQFPVGVSPNSLANAPTLGGIVITDSTPHGDKRLVPGRAQTGGWWQALLNWLGMGRPQPYPSAYLVSQRGAVIRNLEFIEAKALPLGLAEARDGRLAISFYQGLPGVEVWAPDLNTKLTFHDVGLKPALPVYDGEGLLWMPCTIADRMNEEGSRVLALWAYKPGDGKRWEVFARRQFVNVKLPHSIHFDSSGRLAVAGLRAWIFEDGMYGRELKDGVDADASHTALDFYVLTNNPASPAYVAEQKGRFAEMHDGREPTEADMGVVQSIHFTAALELAGSFDFPFAQCLWPLFILMNDGHAITACHGGSALRVLRYGDVLTGGAAGRKESEAASARAARFPGGKFLREPNAPTVPAGFHSVRLRDAARAVVVADLEAPYGLTRIVGLAADPSGNAFTILDAASRQAVSVAWPFPELTAGAPPPASPIVVAPPQPVELKFAIGDIPRST